jgi:hypothetical protein
MTQRTEMRRDVLRLGSLAALSPAIRLPFSHAGLTTSSTFLVRGEDFRTENWLLAVAFAARSFRRHSLTNVYERKV